MGINNGQTHLETSVSIELFRSIFEKLEPGVVIESIEEEHGSGRGDNYTAALYRIHLNGHRTNINGKPNKWDKTVICKRLPDDQAKREAYRSEDLFRNEMIFYNRIMPELQQFQKSKCGELFKAMPKCYLAQDDLVILEDLRVRNFKMPDRQSGLSYNEMVAVLKELAKYHALCIAYKDQNPEQFKALMSLVVEGIFNETNANWYSNYYQSLSAKTIEMVSESLSPDSVYVTRLKSFIGNDSFFDNMVELVKSTPALDVLCHGDCWTNNFLYVYDDKMNVKETCLLDFQLIRHGSPAMDLANLIFCCTDKTLRKNHQNSFLEIYHNELVKMMEVLGLCGCKMNMVWNQLQDDWKKYAKFGLGLALDILPISTCGADDAPDLYTLRTDDSSTHDMGQPLLDLPPNDMWRQKMTDIVVDLVDAGLL